MSAHAEREIAAFNRRAIPPTSRTTPPQFLRSTTRWAALDSGTFRLGVSGVTNMQQTYPPI
jgi:hypothetical protein